MSRIAVNSITIPEGVSCSFDQNMLTVKGKLSLDSTSDLIAKGNIKTQKCFVTLDASTGNEEIINMAPTTEGQRIFLEKAVNKLAPHRTDIGTFFDLMVLEDEKSFEYWNL